MLLMHVLEQIGRIVVTAHTLQALKHLEIVTRNLIQLHFTLTFVQSGYSLVGLVIEGVLQLARCL